MKKSLFFLSSIAIGSALFLSSCTKEEEKKVEEPDTSFYSTKLGGSTLVADPKNSGKMIEQGYLNLRSVVDSTIFIIAGDKNLNPFFAVLLGEKGDAFTSNFTKLSTNLTVFFAENTGAKNFKYTGLNMKDAHNATNTRMTGLVNDIDFTRFVNAVVAGAAKNKITDATVVGPIGALLESLRPMVVQTPMYDLLGGTKLVNDPKNAGTQIEQGRLTLRSVVDSTIFVIAGDKELQPFFKVLLTEVGNNDVTGFTALSKSLTDFFCVATGAKNFTYTGLNMKDAHNATNKRMTGLVDNAAYTKFINDVVAGAGKNGVPSNAPIVAELGRLLETLRTTVVQK